MTAWNGGRSGRPEAEIWGVWREGPWMATRTSVRHSDGSARKRPVYVMELKLPDEPYDIVHFSSRTHRDLYAWWTRKTYRWRRAERRAEAIRAARRAYR